MGAILVPVVIIVIVVVAATLSFKRFVVRERARADRLYADREAVMRYQVPHGQDPAAVLVGLGRAGYEATIDPVVGETNELAIARGEHSRMDREELRDALAGITQLNMEGDQSPVPTPIRFADE